MFCQNTYHYSQMVKKAACKFQGKNAAVVAKGGPVCFEIIAQLTCFTSLIHHVDA